MNILSIDLRCNKIGDDGIIEFSLALKELKLLNSLTIDFCDNKIGNDGA